MYLKLLALKQLYLRQFCGEKYCESVSFSKPQPPLPAHSNLAKIVESCALCELHKRTNRINPKILGDSRKDSSISFITLKPILPYSASFEMIKNIANRVFGVETYNLFSLIKCNTDAQITQNSALACLEYLRAQMREAKNCAMFVIFGEEVARFTLGVDESIENLRGRIINNANKSNFLVTFHISDLLRNQALKKSAFEDFKVAKAFLDNQK